MRGTTEIGKYHLSYSMKAPSVSLSNNASKIRDINLPEITDIRRRSKMARNYRIRKRRKKRKKGKKKLVFNIDSDLSLWRKSSRLSSSSRERSGRRKLTNFPRYIGSSRDSSHRRERYSPRKETWADKTGSGATGCDRGNQRTHYIAVTDAEEGKLFDILLI